MGEVGLSGNVSINGSHDEYEIDECCKIAESMMERIQMLDEIKIPRNVSADKEGSRSGQSIRQKLIRSLRRVRNAAPGKIS